MHARWRKRLLRDMVGDPARFPLTEKLSPEQLQERLDSGISFLREVRGSSLCSTARPTSGTRLTLLTRLVYIILSRKTREGAYQQGFKALKERFRTWDELLDAPRDEVERLVFSGGLLTKKVASLYGALGTLRATFGSCTLEPARGWPDSKLEAFLCQLPEIQRKSAYCVMMFSFGPGLPG